MVCCVEHKTRASASVTCGMFVVDMGVQKQQLFPLTAER